MAVIFVILLIFIFVFFYFYHCNQSNSNFNIHNIISKEKFESEYWTFDNDYNSCYANSNCTIEFLPNGSNDFVVSQSNSIKNDKPKWAFGFYSLYKKILTRRYIINLLQVIITIKFYIISSYVKIYCVNMFFIRFF